MPVARIQLSAFAAFWCELTPLILSPALRAEFDGEEATPSPAEENRQRPDGEPDPIVTPEETHPWVRRRQKRALSLWASLTAEPPHVLVTSVEYILL